MTDNQDAAPAPPAPQTPPPPAQEQQPQPVVDVEPFKSPLGFEEIRSSAAPNDPRRIEIR
jgi:hypothetical protein